MPAHERSFFVIAPKQVARLETEATSMAGPTTDAQEHHHDLSSAVTTNKNKAIY